jgi:NADH-quinone oxidoreductase subunit F
MGTSGLAAGADRVLETFIRELARRNDEKTVQKKIIFKSVGDRGIFRDTLVDVLETGRERIRYDRITPGKVSRIVEEHLLGGIPVADYLAGDIYEKFFRGQSRRVLANCGEIDPESLDEYIENGGYEGLNRILNELCPDEVTEIIKESGIRGRGGAGFPTGLKWAFAAKKDSPEKYIICNADEGDPGAFMDRSVLEGDPFAVLEGMSIAGYATGASQGYVYVRAEYPLAIQRLKKAIETAYDRKYLGPDIMERGFSFDISIREGAGAFVCGEETSLIRSIEGERGMPRPRPPYPANKGLFGKPTVINNVETLANIPIIIRHGSDYFQTVGKERSTGTKVFALAGKVKNTGLVEVPMGTTIREVIFGPGGGMLSPRSGFKAVQMGGPSGGCLPMDCLDTSIDYESITETGAIMGSGGMIVMDESTCMVDIARYFIGFTASESCGKCPPCREGLTKMLHILDSIVEGKGSRSDITELERLALLIKKTALCGLGNTAPNPVLTTLKYFPEEYNIHVTEKRCPAHVCPALIKYRIMKENCSKCGLCRKACPVNAIQWERGNYATIDLKKCIQCRSCIEVCDFSAIE